VANDPARVGYFTKGDFLLAPFGGAIMAAGSGCATCPFVLRVGLIVASIGSVARTVSFAIHFWNVIAIRPKQQLFPHFRKARAAILAVELVE
jgi:hypothetical protein